MLKSMIAAALAMLMAGVATAQALAEVPFRNVRVFDGKPDRLTAPTSVLVRGNVIAACYAQMDLPSSVDRLGRLCKPAGVMARFPSRDLAAEASKHFHGTPEERILAALRLGEEALDLYLATLPRGTTREQARRTLQRNKNRGRRPSAVTRSE